VGSKIKNRAAIYFDYNAPIITNQVVNTIATTEVSVQEYILNSKNDAVLFPNPASNQFTLLYMTDQSGTAELGIYDISGRQLSVKQVDVVEGENRFTERTSDLSSGIYFVQLKAGDRTIGKKLVISK
jgi:hypothetical protein